MIVGIDNGLDGGLCAISKHNGSLIDKIRMPTRHVGSKKEIDIKAICSWLDKFNTPFVLAIEEPLAHAKSSQAVRSMALSFGKLIGMAECKNYTVARISVHKWQKALLGNVPKGHTKKFAFSLANRLEPEENWLANKRCRTPHDGMVDAYLIAKYYQTKNERSATTPKALTTC